MVRVRLKQISSLSDSYDEVVEMAAVPQVGDSITPSEKLGECEVFTVNWLVGNPSCDVIIKFR